MTKTNYFRAPAMAAAVLAACLLVLSGAGIEPVRAQGSQEASPVPAEGVVPGEILVKFEPTMPETKKKEVHRNKGGQTKEVVPEIDVEVVRVAQGHEHSQAADYQSDPNVRYAEPNGLYRPTATTNGRADDGVRANGAPTDSKVGRQWAYNNTGKNGWKRDADIDAFEAWDVTTGSKSIPIAVLDTGISRRHGDLPKVAKTVNFSNSSTPNDIYGHGTHVAGTIAALTNNGRKGVAGTCPGCTLYNVKVLDDNGDGSYSSVAKGVRWAANNGAKVINMSLGGTTPSYTLREALNHAWRKGAILVGAAGNDGVGDYFYPAAYHTVLAVGATNYHDRKASFSNHGSSWVDVGAPGVGIFSTTNDGGYARKSGTSMAVAHVAGVAGLVWSISGSGASNERIRQKIESRVDRIEGTGTYWSKGRINACKAVGGSCEYRQVGPERRRAGVSK